MPNTITYISNLADDRYPNELGVDDKGSALLTLRSNRNQRGDPVGRFRARLPEDNLRRLRQLVHNKAFLESPSQATLVPDETYRKIGVVLPNGTETEKLIGEELKAPAEFVAAENGMKRIMEQLRRFPELAVGLEVRGLPGSAAAGAIQEVTVSLANLGPGAFHIDAPASWSAATTSAEMVALRADVALADLRSEHQVFTPLSAETIRKVAPRADGGPMTLAKDARLDVTFAVPLDWPEGAYDVEVTLAVRVTDAGSGEVFEGELVSPPMRIALKGK